MTNLGERYIDLIASGDASKIKCVTSAGIAGAVAGGVGAAALTAPMNVVPGVGNVGAGTIIGISAVVGMLIGIKAGLGVCGKGTEGSLDKIFTSKVDGPTIDQWTNALVTRGLKKPQATALVSAAIIEIQTNGLKNIDRNVKFNAQQLQMLGDRLAGVVA